MDDDRVERGADDKEFLVRLGQKIKALRLDRGLSQEQLGFAAGLTQHYVSQVEQGDRNVSILTLRALAVALEVGIEVLFEGT